MIGPIFAGIKEKSRAGCLLVSIKILLKAFIVIITVWADYKWLPVIIVMVSFIIAAELYLQPYSSWLAYIANLILLLVNLIITF